MYSARPLAVTTARIGNWESTCVMFHKASSWLSLSSWRVPGLRLLQRRRG